MADALVLLANLIANVAVSLWQIVSTLAEVGLPWLPAGLWCAWWLWCVNWKKAWPVLATGGWVVVVLLTLLGAISWTALFPRPSFNFWWQLGACSVLAVVALFCGWLQGILGWTPAEVSFEPPESHGHAAHAHHH